MRFLLPLFIGAAFSVTTSLAYSELATPQASAKAKSSSPQNYAQAELNTCKPQLDPSGGPEEFSARKAAEKQDLPREELLARIIYSEALSTGYWNGLCQSPSDTAIMEGIGWGVLSRVKAKKKAHLDPYSETIFAKSQFRTSFSSKKENPFAEAFLCPLKADKYLSKTKLKTSASALYKNAQAISQKLIAEFEANGIPEKYKKVTNFFYPHSEFFGEMRPKWAPDKEASKNKGYVNILGVPANPCVEFYNL